MATETRTAAPLLALAAVVALRPDLPSLIITGYADSEAIGERPDDVAVLGKPFSLEQLAHMIAVVRPSDVSAAEVGLPIG